MTENVTVEIPHDDYEIEVKVGIGAIIRAIERAEEEGDDDFLTHGPRVLDLSKYTNVSAFPSEEKWTELADRYYEE